MQAYELPRFPLVHADLYRLSGPAELAELGFEDMPGKRWCCWNGRTAPPAFCRPTGSTSRSRCRRSKGETFRNARVTGYGSFAARVERMPPCAASSTKPASSEAERRRMQGDASTRSYERLTLDGQSYHADEFAAPAGRTRRCATASPTARSRIWPKT